MNVFLNDLELAAHYFFQLLRMLPPEATLFLAIALGYGFGRIKFGAVQFGGVCGTLIMALLFGQADIAIDGGIKNFFFALFIFALGFSGGPQFFANLNIKSLKLIVLSLIEVFVVLALALAVMRYLGFDPGTTAGLVAGAATESAVIGTASEALARLPLGDDSIAKLQANVVTAYSVTYIFGLVAIVLFTSQIAPRLLATNLRQAAETLWTKIGSEEGEEDETIIAALPVMTGRVYLVSLAAGKTIAAINDLLGNRARVERVVRNDWALPASPGLVLLEDDLVLVMGELDRILRATNFIGQEVGSSSAINMVVEHMDFMFTQKSSHIRTLGQLTAEAAHSQLNSEVYISSVLRNNQPMPLASDLVLHQGDIIRLYGSHPKILTFGERFGKKHQRSSYTNLIFMGLGLVAGLLIGRISIPIGAVIFSLGSGGGALLSGLFCGWLQAKHPSLHGAPPAALAMMKDIGLTTFVACVGLASGSQAITLVKEFGMQLPIVGICITLLPAIISLIVGRWLLKIELPILLGGIAGQQCSTPALSAVQAAAGNTTPVMGYTITYAISNALLPLLGPVIVGLSKIITG